MGQGHTIEQQDGVVVIAVDSGQCTALVTVLEPSLAAGARAFVLNLAGVDYLNSMNIAGLITLRNKLQQKGARMELANVKPQVASILRVLKLERLFALDRDLAAAVAAAKT